jgi:hypothetical protein
MAGELLEDAERLKSEKEEGGRDADADGYGAQKAKATAASEVHDSVERAIMRVICACAIHDAAGETVAGPEVCGALKRLERVLEDAGRGVSGAVP